MKEEDEEKEKEQKKKEEKNKSKEKVKKEKKIKEKRKGEGRRGVRGGGGVKEKKTSIQTKAAQACRDWLLGSCPRVTNCLKHPFAAV